MRFRAAMLMGVLWALPVCAADFARDSIPGKWIEPLTPEQLPALVYPKYFDDLDKAKSQVFSGRYKLALQTIRAQKITGDAADLLQARAMEGLGRYDEALQIAGGLKTVEGQLCRVDLLDEMGRAAEALSAVKQVVEAHPDSLAGHLKLGQLCEETGDVAGARSAYEWFVATPQNYLERWKGLHEKLFDHAEDAVVLGRALDRWAVLDGEYPKDDSLHNTILDLFVKAYDVIDRKYWPAHVAAAEYYLGHDDGDSGKKELAAALAGNPNDAHSLELLGEISLTNFDFDAVDGIVDALRKCDAESVSADILEIRNLLQQRQPKQAEGVARILLARQPRQPQALALLAAAEALQLHDGETAGALKQVDAVNPHGAEAYFDVAEQLGAMRQYPRAAAMYKIAIERAPWWTQPRNGLGLLYTQSGDEDLARSTLDAAHQLDPFNLATTNYLRLLDELAGFDRKESAHFIVEYDEKLDPVVPEYFNDYLESMYSQVTGDYHTEPAAKTVIEVFPTHDAFSVRTTGTPWIGTVGASTGRIIAMVAPRKGENTQGAFNWSQVLRHEFTHTVTLAATDNRISHWMTEGLAVMEEHAPLQWTWVPMLYDAVSKKTLFDMDQLTWAFIRPRRPSDRQLAYAESFWVCTYIDQTYGHDAILKMLAEFKAGGLQEQVIQKILGKPQEQFFADFEQWAGKQIQGWGYDAESSKRYDELKGRGEELVQRRQYDDAVGVWEEIAVLRPMDELPHRRLAGLYSKLNKPEKAIEQFEILNSVDIKNDAYPKRIAELFRDSGKLDEAERFGLKAIYIDPYDLQAHELMAELCEKNGDANGLAREQRVIPMLKQWMEEMKKSSAVQ